VCVKQHGEWQHSPDASRAVDKAHQEGGQQERDSRRMDDTLHKPRHHGNQLQLAVILFCVIERHEHLAAPAIGWMVQTFQGAAQ